MFSIKIQLVIGYSRDLLSKWKEFGGSSLAPKAMHNGLENKTNLGHRFTKLAKQIDRLRQRSRGNVQASRGISRIVWIV